jgi:plasmid stabilization system protein ParE
LALRDQVLGIEQADSYEGKIYRAIEEIQTFPDGAPMRHDIRRGHRGKLVGEHIIVYQVSGEMVIVKRILHQSMDLPGRF